MNYNFQIIKFSKMKHKILIKKIITNNYLKMMQFNNQIRNNFLILKIRINKNKTIY